MGKRAVAIIMGVVTLAFVVGAIVFAVNQQRQSSARDALRERGIDVPLESRSFLEQDTRRLNPNTGRYDRYSDDQVLFTFLVPEGEEAVVAQPISEDRYQALGPIFTLGAVYLEGEPEGAELLDDGDFVANTVPYWLFALLCSLLALGSAASAYTSTRETTRG